MANTSYSERIQQGFIEHVDESKLLDCMRCGFCLPSCPTYIHSNFDESQSPRGRIALMKAVRDGLVPFDDSVEESLDMCLGCRACEPACPAGVEYGSLLESAREVIQKEKKKSVKEKFARKVAFEHLFKEPEKMSKTVGLVRFYQKSGLQKLSRKTHVLSLFPTILKDMESVLPEIEKKNLTVMRGMVFEAKKKATKVAFFTGCLMETIFSKTNKATVQILQQLGCDIVVPQNQVCCGALQGHSGELENARENARRNIDSFLAEEIDYIVNNAGGCGAFLSEYNHLLKDDKEYMEKAKRFSEKIIDITSLIYKLGITKLPLANKKGSLTVTYQDSCHLRNVNGVITEPREILQSIENVNYIELKGADQCCGSAGIYNLIHSEMSMKILDTRMENVQHTNAHIIITTNPGCLLQMKVGIERANLTGKIEALHLIDFLYDYVLDEGKLSLDSRKKEQISIN
ncbi:(Fe-S)-binding protein [Caldibacillus lycopersici]|uniref:Glycolate oxidase iron-sulfur subunit n=1 Tax=Perspicuibacillus lycopersici TaxID=1325689 RepID=A0AAE3LN17_9BACI|nr:(Fe-S)-binding protein [Perspicuibacillus lycopersici]MCU9613496.1 (Fe-S)-binding protein [Perspicuibacillus lycopersici]